MHGIAFKRYCQYIVLMRLKYRLILISSQYRPYVMTTKPHVPGQIVQTPRRQNQPPPPDPSTPCCPRYSCYPLAADQRPSRATVARVATVATPLVSKTKPHRPCRSRPRHRSGECCRRG